MGLLQSLSQDFLKVVGGGVFGAEDAAMLARPAGLPMRWVGERKPHPLPGPDAQASAAGPLNLSKS